MAGEAGDAGRAGSAEGSAGDLGRAGSSPSEMRRSKGVRAGGGGGDALGWTSSGVVCVDGGAERGAETSRAKGEECRRGGREGALGESDGW